MARDMKQRDLTSAKAKEALLKDRDKFCGECCWFYGEDPYGYGMCPHRFGELQRCSDRCPTGDKYVGKQEMRHHLAVLLELKGWHEGRQNHIVDPHAIHVALDFACKYIKTFSEI